MNSDIVRLKTDLTVIQTVSDESATLLMKDKKG